MGLIIVGSVMLYAIFLPAALLYLRSAKWDRVEAQLLSASIVQKSSSSTGGRIRKSGVHINYNAEYVFTYNGREHHGNRASNCGWGVNPQKDLPELERLIDQYESTGEWGTVKAWVNPKNPNESFLFRHWSGMRTYGTLLFSAMAVIPALIILLVALFCGWRWWLAPMNIQRGR